MHKRRGLLLIALVVMAGCSHSPFNEVNRFSLNEYEDELFLGCMSSDDFVKHTDTKEATCRDVSHAFMVIAQKRFEKQKSEQVTERCSERDDFNQCVYTYQKAYYDLLLTPLMKKAFSDSEEPSF